MKTEPTAEQIEILDIINEANGLIFDPGGYATARLARMVDIDVKELSAKLRRLQRNGLIAREIDGRRTRSISITQAGVSLLKKRMVGTPAMNELYIDPIKEITKEGISSTGVKKLAPQVSNVSHHAYVWDQTRQTKKAIDVCKTISGIVLRVQSGEISPLSALTQIENLVKGF